MRGIKRANKEVVIVAHTKGFVSSELQQADGFARNAPKDLSIKDLAEYLSRAGSQLAKIRATYTWVCDNIKYDMIAYENEIYIDDPQKVWINKSTLCGGYAMVFKELLNEMDIEAEVIYGFFKGDKYFPGDELTEDNLHAWNAVKLDAAWIHIDCTLGSGYLDPINGYTRYYDSYYFAPNPHEFCYTHYPEDEKWQLKQEPLSLDYYTRLPTLKRAFFKNGLTFESPMSAVFETDTNLVFILRNAPQKASKVHIVKDGTLLRQNYGFSQRLGDSLFVYADFPETGKYEVKLFIQVENENYEIALVVGVDCTGVNSPKIYPTKLAGFYENNIFVITPLNGVLLADDNIEFNIVADNAALVGVGYFGGVSAGTVGEMLLLDDFGDYWGCWYDVPDINRSNVLVQDMDAEEGNYSVVLEYQIEQSDDN